MFSVMQPTAELNVKGVKFEFFFLGGGGRFGVREGGDCGTFKKF